MSDDGRHWSDESWKLPDDVHPCVTPHFDCSAGSPPCVSYHCAGFHPGLDGHGFRIQFRPAHIPGLRKLIAELERIRDMEAAQPDPFRGEEARR